MTRASARETFISHAIDALREAETQLPSDVREALARAATAETSERAKELLCAILEKSSLRLQQAFLCVRILAFQSSLWR